MTKMASRLFDNATEQEAFLQALIKPAERLQGVILMRDTELPGEEKSAPWLAPFARILVTSERLGQRPEHDEGAYYLLDPSSLFGASCLLAIPPDDVHDALDLCAAPGGKSVYGWRHLQPDVLTCNEVIGKRHGPLVSNLRRCQITPSEVTQKDAERIAEEYPEHFDAVWVDAPCSGQSLLAQGKDAFGAFHPSQINMNANRQKRIMANAVQAVKPGGWLAYMTCTFSPEENEEVIEWLLKKNTELEVIPVPHLQKHAARVGYRLYPHQGWGAGAYCCLLRRVG